MKNKDYSQEFVHLVDLYTHCNMMHGTYNVKLMLVVKRRLHEPYKTEFSSPVNL